MNEKFKLVSNFKPKGDQPKAIKQLVNGLNKGFDKHNIHNTYPSQRKRYRRWPAWAPLGGKGWRRSRHLSPPVFSLRQRFAPTLFSPFGYTIGCPLQ